MTIEELNLDVHTFNIVKRAGVDTVEDLKSMIENEPEKLRRNTGYATFDKLKKLVEIMSAGTEDGTTETAPSVIVSNDYTKAVALTRSIIANAQAAQQSLYEVCKGLKEMRDGKLYKELGYQNFEDYTENEVGIKKVQAYNFVAIASNLSADYVQSIEQIGTTKLTLLAKLDEPTREMITETIDVESVTVNQLKAEIETLQRKNEKLESETADLGQQLDAAKENINRQNSSFVEHMQEKNKQLSEAQVAVTELEKRIKELEEQPIDHVMTDADTSEEIEQLRQELENERLRAETIKKQADALKDEQERKRMDLMNRHEQDMKKLREGYEKQLEDAGLDAASKQELRDEGYIKALKDRFEDVIDALENYIEDLTPGEILKHMKAIDEYYRRNLLYLLEDSSEKV